MYDDSRADWTLDQHTAELACEVKGEGSAEWEACRRLVVHMRAQEKAQREVLAALEADPMSRDLERLSRLNSTLMKVVRTELHVLMDLQTERWRRTLLERQRAMGAGVREEAPRSAARRRKRVC